MTITKQTSTSPSPSPTVPVSSTPGPRATAFITLYHSALQSTLKAISYESFAACFPLISAQAPEALKVMWQGMRDGLEGFAVKEFEMILQERDVVTRLNALEAVIADANKRRDTSIDTEKLAKDIQPPHTLPPDPLVTAHLIPLYLSQQSQLNAKLQTIQSLNASLMTEIHDQQKEIAALLAVSEKLVGDLEGAADVMNNTQRLGREAREAETILCEFDSER